MNQTEVQDRSLRYLAAPAYLLAFVMLLMPLVDAMVAIGTFSPTLYRWRLGAMGILATNVVTPLVALVLALTVASLSRHRWVVRGIAGVSLVLAVVLGAMMILFVLDGLQMRAELPAETNRGFLTVTGKALLAQLLALAGLVVIGRAALKIGRGMGAGKRPTRGGADSLVMASSSR